MTNQNQPLRALAAVAVILLLPSLARAHGYAGERFFPPTITTDDPFAADELALPTLSFQKVPGDQGGDVRQYTAGFELDKLILPNLSLGISDTHLWQKPQHSRATNGWDNLELNLKYNACVNPPHETIISLGLHSEIGGTGTRHIGAAGTSTFEPILFFGKGFGDLPDSLDPLKPFAVTGLVGQTFPTGGDEANVLEWGFALQYNLPYLQSHVKDVGLPKPFRDMIPLVEFAFETAENRADRGRTTGSINPGVLWESRYFQVGAEALIPINRESGSHVGVIIQAWIFLDDLSPATFGHPIFGARAGGSQ